MARVAALVPDLLFASKIQGLLQGAGHEVRLVAPAPESWGEDAGRVDVLLVDLVSAAGDGIALIERLRADGTLEGVATLAVYSHVDAATRTRALDAGFDLVVPRSRMMREGVELVTGLVRA